MEQFIETNKLKQKILKKKVSTCIFVVLFDKSGFYGLYIGEYGAHTWGEKLSIHNVKLSCLV